MFRVRFFSHWNGYSNVYDFKDFEKLEEAEEYAAGCYDATLYRRVQSKHANSTWEYVPIVSSN